MNRLQKYLMISRDQGLTTNSSAQGMETSAIAVTFSLVVQMLTSTTFLTAIATTIPATTSEVEQQTNESIDLFICDPSPTPSPIKRNRRGCLFPLIDGGSSKLARLSEDT